MYAQFAVCVVSKAKDKYEATLNELARLMKKWDELRNQDLLDAFAARSKSYEEIMTFVLYACVKIALGLIS